MIYVPQIYQTETSMNVILILTLFPLGDYRNHSPGRARRMLPVQEFSPRVFSPFVVYVH